MLPAKPSSSKIHTDETAHIKAGTWWRLVDESHSLAEKPAPDHGLILLLKEVRIIDGEIHTLVLANHPTWYRGDFKILFDEFVKVFALEPNGQALRAKEQAALMDEIKQINASISEQPSQEALLPLIAAEREKRASSKSDDAASSSLNTGIVPASLLPSQDVVSAQAALENQIVEMNARATWIKERTEEITQKYNVVASYQEETVETELAKISDVTEQAQGLLKNVQTMRLFLGEDIQVEHLIKGKSAPDSEPLTLLQSMLFLDEELFVEAKLLDGFDYSNLGDLSEMLKNNPRFVERMMPYERCAVITRVRRDDKPLPAGKEMSFAAMWEYIEENKANKWIQILIRDGENIWMVIADEATSKAKRLFPSAEEIDAIFSEDSYIGGGEYSKRVISPQDIEYSDRRAEHDDRALFYKRFLIMFWGLHEREGIFGSFMPKGMNWLEHSTHSDYFKFVHDEEGVLGDGRLPVDEYIESVNETTKDGSRIAAWWSTLADVDTAPSMFEEPGHSHRPSRIGYPIEDFTVTTAKIVDGNLTVLCKGRSDTGKLDDNYEPIMKNRRFPVALENRWIRDVNSADGDRISTITRRLNRGFLCMDSLRIEDLDYYIESRINRRQYLGYLQLFASVRKLLAEEAAASEDLFAKARATDMTLSQASVSRALQLWRHANKWALPTRPIHAKNIQKTARIIQDGVQGFSDAAELMGALQISVNAKGNLIVLKEISEPMPINSLLLPVVQAEEYACNRGGELSLVGSEVRNLMEDRVVNEFVLATPSQAKLDAAGKNKDRSPAIPFSTPASFDLLKEIQGDVSLEGFRNIKGQIEHPTKEMADTHLANLYSLTYSKENKEGVRTDEVSVDLGVVMMRSPKEDWQSYVVSLELDAMTFFYVNGSDAEVRAWINSVVASPEGKERWIRKFKKAKSSGKKGFSLTYRDLGTRDLHSSFKPDLYYRHAGSRPLQAIGNPGSSDSALLTSMTESILPAYRYAFPKKTDEELDQERLLSLKAMTDSAEIIMNPEILAYCEDLLNAS